MVPIMAVMPVHRSSGFLTRLTLAVLIAGSAECSAASNPDEIDGTVSSAEAMERLRKGEILVENTRTEKSGGSVRVQALFQGDVKKVWEYIASCDSVYLYVDGVTDCEVLKVEREPGSDTTLLRQRLKKSWLVPTMEYTISVHRRPPDRVDFKLVEGDLKEMVGGWRFLPLENEPRFIITHEIRVSPSFPSPRWLIRRSMRKDVPDMLACLRGLTDASGAFSNSKDLDRCP